MFLHISDSKLITRLGLSAILTIVPLLALTVVAQDGYKKAPPEVSSILSAPVTPNVYVSPTRDAMLLATSLRYPPLADLAEPMLRLAGQRINPNNNGPHRYPYFVALSLKRLTDDAEIKITLPPGAKIGVPIWSADGKRFVFTNTTASGVELWSGEARNGAVRRMKDVRVNTTSGDALQWMPDNRTLMLLLVPAKRAAAPTPVNVPREPNWQESTGRPGPVRTFQDLLKTPHDENLFEYYATAQLAMVDSSSGKISSVGTPGIFRSIDVAPDGNHILVGRIHRPFSYLYPDFAFPRDVEVWDTKGKLIHKLASLPLADQIPIDGVATGPRNYRWRPTEPATLIWVEALDGGDPKKKVSHRDRILMLKAPFSGTPAELYKTEQRFAGLQFGEKAGLAFISDYDRDRRWSRTFMMNLDRNETPKMIWSRNVQDRYGDPGAPITRLLYGNTRAILQDGDWILLSGAGASPEGDRPFLDRFNLTTLKSERVFRSEVNNYEAVVAVLSDDGKRFITRRESPTETPNYQLVDARSGAVIVKSLTKLPDPTPQLSGIKKQLVTYNRADGVQCSFTLYLPPGYKAGTRLPTVVWAYPLEFTDASTAGQVTGSTQRYTQLIGPTHLFFLLQGYAVLDNATMPVVGNPETVNNTYIEQIVMSAKAAIDKAAEMGVTDPERVGVGGHSYGAFMTANLLAHSNLFRAGIARSGAYNRTLTPFGFQSERRTIWEAPDLYIKVSPFMVANKINEPILFIHGEADDNSGTFPIQSERMYQAVRGNGGTVRLVTLPLEAHGYASRETIEHVLYEMITWFDKHVKNAPARAKEQTATN
ncbi:MAG TPA: prolyl oligopeptidase family serine peptidase [Pyrinomonadaceae bacterium]|nr:prolyl oligopeptidase family serine peptidase [Pyrinomonadaceae bacterium]